MGEVYCLYYILVDALDWTEMRYTDVEFLEQLAEECKVRVNKKPWGDNIIFSFEPIAPMSFADLEWAVNTYAQVISEKTGKKIEVKSGYVNGGNYDDVS